mmetsp:Transcript_125781/g.361661  ORF Transcript_125781/g.361661 Transcript_125781/m.361661 type:complete len:200 (-) Transcript_125781:205-804(-)
MLFVHLCRGADDDGRRRERSGLTEITKETQHPLCSCVHVIHRHMWHDFLEGHVGLFGSHHNMVENIACHDEVQVVLGGHGVAFSNTLLGLFNHGIHVAVHLALRNSEVAHCTDLLDNACERVPPIPGVCVDGNGGNRTSLAERIAMVDLHRRVAGAIARYDAKLQHADENAHDDKLSDVLQMAQWSCRSLGIKVQLQSL